MQLLVTSISMINQQVLLWDNNNFGGQSFRNKRQSSPLNLLRWVSPRTIKETFVTPVDYRYPFLGE
jgi:hypothetical protein